MIDKPTPDMTDEELQTALERLESSMNERQLRFAFNKHQGRSNRDSFKGSGYTARSEESMDAAASNLLRSQKVQSYLAIKGEQDRRVNRISRESIITSMARLGKAAEADKDYSAAKNCYAEAAKLLDFYPAAKSEVDIKDDRKLNDMLQNLDDDQVRQLFAAKREQEERENVHH